MKRVSFKKIAVVFMAVLMMVSMLAINSAAANDAVNEASGAIVKVVREVVYTSETGIETVIGRSVGSGVLVASEEDTSASSTTYVLTAYGVVNEKFYAEDFFTIGSANYLSYVGCNGRAINDLRVANTKVKQYILLANGQPRNFIVANKSTEQEWALLLMDRAATNIHALKVAKSSELKPDDELWSLGFSYTDEKIEFRHNYTKNDVLVDDGKVNNANYRNYALVEGAILHDANISGGNYGGAVVNANGDLVAINVATFNASGNYSLATPIDNIVESVAQDGRILLAAGNDYVIWIAIGAAGLVVLAGLVLLIVLLAKRGKKVEPVAAAPAEAPAAVPHVSIQTGRLAGHRYRIDGVVKIGRDGSQCQIVYPADTAGVSGTHCEIFVQNGVVYLRDLKSSYGTFLGNGTKLQPGSAVMIPIGSTFYLASPENTFVVRF